MSHTMVCFFLLSSPVVCLLCAQLFCCVCLLLCCPSVCRDSVAFPVLMFCTLVAERKIKIPNWRTLLVSFYLTAFYQHPYKAILSSVPSMQLFAVLGFTGIMASQVGSPDQGLQIFTSLSSRAMLQHSATKSLGSVHEVPFKSCFF